MNNWFKTHDMLVKAIATTLVAVVIVFVAILPMYQSSNKVLAKIRTKSKELDSLTTKVSILSKLDKNVLAERMLTMDAALPPRKDVLLYLTSIDGLSRELGLTLGGLALNPGDISEATPSSTRKVAENTNGLQSLETEIKIQGNQDSIYTFLRVIESVLPLMQIKNISVDVSQSNNYSLSLSLGMLWASPVTSSVSGPVSFFGEEEDKYFTQLASFRKFDPLPMGTIDNMEIKKDLFLPEVLTPQQ